MTPAADAGDPPPKKMAALRAKLSAVGTKVDDAKEKALSKLSPRNRSLVENYAELTWSQLVAMVPLTLLQVGAGRDGRTGRAGRVRRRGVRCVHVTGRRLRGAVCRCWGCDTCAACPPYP
jgi:hypothetical protein